MVEWKEFIGNGCKEEKIIDCIPEDENYNLEIGCFEECTYKSGMFRSAFSTIMRNHITNPYSFGLWNEKLIKDELDKFSGD